MVAAFLFPSSPPSLKKKRNHICIFAVGSTYSHYIVTYCQCLSRSRMSTRVCTLSPRSGTRRGERRVLDKHGRRMPPVICADISVCVCVCALTLLSHLRAMVARDYIDLFLPKCDGSRRWTKGMAINSFSSSCASSRPFTVHTWTAKQPDFPHPQTVCHLLFVRLFSGCHPFMEKKKSLIDMRMRVTLLCYHYCYMFSCKCKVAKKNM